MFEQIKKRDSRIQAFDSSNITEAIAKAGEVTGEFHRLLGSRNLNPDILGPNLGPVLSTEVEAEGD